MSLKIVRLGLTHSASAEYIEEIKMLNQDKKAVLVVPDQYSFAAEKLFSKYFGGTGLNKKYVLTFHQMVRQFVSNDRRNYLLPSGKKMLLKFALKNAVDENSMFYTSSKTNGFLDTVYDMISEFKRYDVSWQMLSDASKHQENKMLRSKIETLSSVYEEYERNLSDGGFLDSEDDIARARDEILKNGFFKDSYVIFDFFTDFSPKHLGVIEAILSVGADVKIYLNASRDGDFASGSLWEFPEKTIRKLENICKKNNILCEIVSGGILKEMSPAIRAYAENFENSDYVYKNQAEEIRVFQAKEKYGEIEHTALLILDMVREEGYNFSDISVVCGNLEEYISFIEPIFYEYHIPYFSDHKVLMTEHPVAVLIMSLFEILDNNFSKEACMNYLRTGFIVSDREADCIENHILRRGIRGNMWQKSEYFLFSDKKVFDDITGTMVKSVENPYMEELRQKIVTPVLHFKEKTKGKKSVRKMAEALFEFMTEIRFYEKTEATISKLISEGFENEAARYERVWNFLVEILEQAVVVSGDEVIGRKDFSELIAAAMSGCEMNIIPTISNGVAVMSADRGAISEAKILFVLGANQNVIPKFSASEGILSDYERLELLKDNIELAPDMSEKSVQAEFKAALMLSSAADILNISFPTADVSGAVKEPSQLVFELLDMFPKMRKSNDFVEDREFLYISSPEATIHKLLIKMADTKAMNTLWTKVKNWYERQEEFSDKMELINTISDFKEYSASLLGENARLLYEDYENYSISRIERYFECPFKYFLENGLKLKEREEWEIGATDTGSLLHWAVSEYCKAIDGDAKTAGEKKENWNRLTEEESKNTIKEILSSAKQKLGISEYDNEKTENILNKVLEALIKSVPVINLSMKNGKYVGAAYEVSFSGYELKNADGNVKIKGIIDRIDIYEDFDEGKAYIRVIDYKSGSKGFSLERVLNRVDLQLMVYAIAAAEMYKSGAFEGFSGKLTPEVKGVFYDKLRNDFVECDFGEVADTEALRFAKTKLDGVLFSREGIEKSSKYLDSADAENMDYEISSTGASRFLKIVKKTKGAGLDKRFSASESDELRDAMLKHVKNGLIEADIKIKSGDVEISPYKYKSASGSACEYCPYFQVCALDREKKPCRKREKSKKEITDEILGAEVK